MKPLFPKYTEIQLPLLTEIRKRNGQTQPSDLNPDGKSVYEALADYFDLSLEARNATIIENGKERSKWHNMVRWTRNDLKKAGLLYSPQRGVWALTQKGYEIVEDSRLDERGAKLSEIDYTISPEDFQALKEKAEKIGDAGELFVLKYERERLIDLGRRDLANQVLQVSKLNVAAGYDVLSFDQTGHEIYIEVKTSSGSNISFEITDNELDKAKQLRDSYFVYKVIDFMSQPRIIFMRDPAKLIEEGQLTLKPIQWKVIPTENMA